MKIKFKKFSISFFVFLFALMTYSSYAQTSAQQLNQIRRNIKNIEKSFHGRIGIFAINTASKKYVAYKSDQRFPMCSTSKLITVGAILKQSMTNPELLQQKIHYSKADIQQSGFAPITCKHINDGMSIAELCNAAITNSDNGADNLLMKKLGGPKAVTQFARSIDDNSFRLDRWEPELNTAIPNDNRDTTTPRAMANSLQKLVLGHILARHQKRLLQKWLIDNKIGNTRIRTGVPKNWIVGDKTGTGEYGTTNDIAIIWPPNHSPIVIAIYLTQNKKDTIAKDKVIASVTKVLIDYFVLNNR